ncbi:monosaccharide ABC transporter ATP-binding protein, CUT2 family [Actinokineospora alba]|uniref:Monosaccharide ABC transporter ATP-binding protein, CUT2 family n=1 Tax=Actinokineospora alba TaxID=504798 RepID=A0A1H0NLY8_9PSEU|nr:sugar ABC transporter ATP-binding protein [Actinokineospora alba]TDP68769.1 L-arabinose transport system ATP-binding protein [Actinokineospora alba]SDH86246.1 L-arabinose transport system ATP-binding protein [Actinokineospora alba]SDO93762.1 monosaccharide ABC transporter ATP-binding protein, CUT2 family [Actinokineospora alba]
MGVSKNFAGVPALREVSVDFPAGQVTALMGENGAGKSTLIKILGGDHQPDGGGLELDGQSFKPATPADARAAGIRVIAQEPEIVPHVSVAENVYLGSLPRTAGRRLDRPALRERMRSDLARLGFAADLDPDTLGSKLTAAQRQLVEIMRALTTEAKVIAFDEPTSSLSEHEAEALFALIGRLREQGLSVIYVSHRMREIFRLADRIAVLRDGAFVGVRAVGETTEEEIVHLMVGRDLSTMFTREHGTPGEVVLDVRKVTTDDVLDVSLQVRSGEVVALAGLVGAGRSELAAALIGDVPIHSGEVRVDGVTLRLRQPRDAVRAGFGYAPEERKAQALLLQRGVRDNITLAMLDRLSRFRVVRRGEENRLAREYVAALRVRTPSIEQEVRKLSGGNQQKVVLARWLARKPKVLVLDEPTRGVDVGAKAEIYRIIDELAASGVAVLVISSELPEVLGLADRIVVMQSGRVTGELGRGATEAQILSLAMAEDLTNEEVR